MHTGTGFSRAREEEFPETTEVRTKKNRGRTAAGPVREDVRRTYAWMEHLRDAWGDGWEPQD